MEKRPIWVYAAEGLSQTVKTGGLMAFSVAVPILI